MKPNSSPPALAGESAGRLFLGIGPPEELRRALDAHLRRALGSRPLPGRAVPAANWHLTLRFLGDTPRSRLDALCKELRATNLGPAFRVGFGDYGAFPRSARASVLWLGIHEGEDSLQQLAAVAETTARSAGFAAEQRPFRAHLTLSRIKPPADLRDLLRSLPPFPESLQVTDLTLFRSHLGGGPARYQALERFRLRTPRA